MEFEQLLAAPVRESRSLRARPSRRAAQSFFRSALSFRSAQGRHATVSFSRM